MWDALVAWRPRKPHCTSLGFILLAECPEGSICLAPPRGIRRCFFDVRGGLAGKNGRRTLWASSRNAWNDGAIRSRNASALALHSGGTGLGEGARGRGAP